MGTYISAGMLSVDDSSFDDFEIDETVILIDSPRRLRSNRPTPSHLRKTYNYFLYKKIEIKQIQSRY